MIDSTTQISNVQLKWLVEKVALDSAIYRYIEAYLGTHVPDDEIVSLDVFTENMKHIIDWNAFLEGGSDPTVSKRSTEILEDTIQEYYNKWLDARE